MNKIFTIIVLAFIVFSAFFAVTLYLCRKMKCGKKVVRESGRTGYKAWSRGVKRGLAAGITATIFLMVATVVFAGYEINNIVQSSSESGGSGIVLDAEASEGETGEIKADTDDTDEEENELIYVSNTVHPGLNLSQEDLDVLTAGIEFYVGRQSLPSWLPIRTELCGFSNAVSTPLDIFIDYDYIEELHGHSKTNPDVKAQPTADVLKAINAKLEEWQKEFTDLPDEERSQALLDAIVEEVAHNIPFADSVVQAFTEQKYYTENNQWLLDLKDMLDQAYLEENGIWSLCEYEEGYDENTPCSVAHVVLRNDIMERKIKNGEPIPESADKEYYSEGYTTLIQKLIALIYESKPLGICKGMTAEAGQNWRLVETADPAFVRTAPSPYDDNEDVFLLQVIDKSEGYIILQYGFNMKDRRIGIYDRKDKPTEVVRKPNLIVQYLEEGTNKALHDQKETYVAPGTKLNEKPVPIDGYTCTNPDISKDVFMTEEGLTLTFYYKKDKVEVQNAKVVVNYLEEGTNKALANQKEYYVSPETVVNETPKDIGNGYNCTNPDAGKNITVHKEGVVITFYYKQKGGGDDKTYTYALKVICQDEKTGAQFDSFSLGDHKAGEVVPIPHPDYDGREFVRGKSTHTMPAEDSVVYLVYRIKNTPPPNNDEEDGKDPAYEVGQQGNADEGSGNTAPGQNHQETDHNQALQDEQNNIKNNPQAESDRQQQQQQQQDATNQSNQEEADAKANSDKESQDKGQPSGTTTDDDNPNSSAGGTTSGNTGANNSGETTGTIGGGSATGSTTSTDSTGNTTTTTTPVNQETVQEGSEITEPPADDD